ncbi:pheromone shutdown-related protein TraB [Desulfitobacterium sp. LBE]|uniref:Conjugal transfer protein TraB n=4 Tax=root TaxID=1 RepID=Q24XB9_DESHY|nr:MULTISPECIES: TraB/GumN family protein [Desulfitobacterium]EHL07257.1 TraB family protein [Desulfitobacterium hafniense DP7]KTE90976.1 conjugal transfer protein TraB [Desulfitobacterium hafniense]MEA5024816.1 TraB/GumN family protein [Desulfitobacterium hafniense]TWH56480.1 pheromone shutdown-related protein TraB [Desulfitobacterium sp. LBE]CDX01591.1 Pheromone shutdown-related protein TraB [Desulfitobacterium hafniense]
MTIENENITRLTLAGKEIILIGTAHVSKQSAELVKEVIEAERPDSVCIELDEQRYKSIVEGDKWKETDIFKIIKEKKATLLLMNLALSSFQKRLAKEFGTNAGQEMLQGIESAQEVGAELVLADRNIQITFSRIWHNVGFWGKCKLLMEIIFSIFDDEAISEEELEKLKSQDMLNGILKDFTESFPKLKTPLIDERDQYLSQKIKEAPGEKIVAVLGAAHVPGITEEIHKEHDLQALTELPPKSIVPKILGWSIPALIIALIAYTFYSNPDAGVQQTLSWVLWTGSLSALGTALAFGHPLAILTAFLAAPIAALHPLIAAGWFAGLVQAYFKRPNVRDFENLSEDILSLKGFWNNQVTRILLTIVFANIGSATGAFIGGADIARLFFQNL